jgi:S-adenosylmethionine synthetase
MPMPIVLAHRLCRRLAQVRQEGLLAYLGPDGKSQVTVDYEQGRPTRVDTVLVSSQHLAEISQERVKADIIEQVIRPTIPAELLDDNTTCLVNPTGRFVIGGPKGDAGLTGRKVIVDTYGGVARHGGGCLSGKDPTKVDRSATYMARYVAKNVVAAGLADRIEMAVSYAIGLARPRSVAIETFGTGRIADERILALIEQHVDLRPAAIIEHLGLRRPLYRQVAAYGHFREDLDLPWERLDRVETLRQAAGLSPKAR